MNLRTLRSKFVPYLEMKWNFNFGIVFCRQSDQMRHQPEDLSKPEQVPKGNEVETQAVTLQENKEPLKYALNENSSEEKSNGTLNLSDSSNKVGGTLEEAPVSELSGQKKCKKGTSGTRNIKKLESRSAPTENIKCTTYTCPICKKVVMKKALFKTHLEVHKSDHKFACEICLRV